MHLSRIGAFLVIAVGIAYLAAAPSRAHAQYNCAVTIELKGKAVLQGQIRDVERPPTDQLWELLKTLSFAPNQNSKDLPDPKTVEQTQLKGDVRVKVNGAGQVQLKELRLVRNKLSNEAWVIAPEEMTRILRLRKATGDVQPKN